MVVQPKKNGIWKLVCAVLIGASLIAAGCSPGGNTANAQDQKRIETLTAGAGAFLLLSEDAPTVNVQEGTTVYTMTSDGSLNLGPSQTFSLERSDVVIERPAAGTVTLIRSR